jgi:hypothetical protein
MMSPMALIWRLKGKDALQRAFDSNRKSYRVQSIKSPVSSNRRVG